MIFSELSYDRTFLTLQEHKIFLIILKLVERNDTKRKEIIENGIEYLKTHTN